MKYLLFNALLSFLYDVFWMIGFFIGTCKRWLGKGNKK